MTYTAKVIGIHQLYEQIDKIVKDKDGLDITVQVNGEPRQGKFIIQTGILDEWGSLIRSEVNSETSDISASARAAKIGAMAGAFRAAEKVITGTEPQVNEE